MDEVAIRVENVSKDFLLPHEKVNSVKSLFTGITKNSNRKKEKQHALKDISFEINKGEFFGIVGRNGSGKSTLLKILANIYQPTYGKVYTKGKLVPFIELGVGFNPELSGRENVYLNGAMLGFSEKEVDAMYDDIVSFAELKRFMDQKLKNYSSGMQVRLAFSMAVRAEADILLIDEVLAVGDADFQRKCYEYFKTLKRDNMTVVFVSHDMNAVREYCDKAILLEKSRLVMEGSPDIIASEYSKLFIPAQATTTSSSNRWGNGDAEYTHLNVSPQIVREHTEYITIEAEFVAKAKLVDPVLGFRIKGPSSEVIMGTNTKILRMETGEYEPKATGKVLWTIPNLFSDGQFSVDVALTANDGLTHLDWWEDAVAFKSYKETQTPYSISPKVDARIVYKSKLLKKKP